MLELAAIVAIVAMLCAVALPSYHEIATRSQVSELVHAAFACSRSVERRYAERRNASPPTVNGWGCESGPGTPTPRSPSQHVRSVTTSADGVIFVTAQDFSNGRIDSKVLTLAPLSGPDQPAVFSHDAGRPLFGWRCGSKADHTTVDGRYLPASCRG